ncbi:hypothetical protein PR202_ga16124 [Eleusine coracana subsp. coracana]|uniref:SAM-dependent MTase DRM-type domain-containing protein n=1 Tax=Eleusine coracana subsp. coracana TaxID=191504 RepID=A0AAV5CLD4_ELECO|nr:hypothetical protein PR202_ga16124 [Eleusine coracana subsp. coracana]
MTKTLINDINDVWELTIEMIEECVTKFGGFYLVIGGSPCGKLDRRNRYHRNGLEGQHSPLFYHYAHVSSSVVAGEFLAKTP